MKPSYRFLASAVTALSTLLVPLSAFAQLAKDPAGTGVGAGGGLNFTPFIIVVDSFLEFVDFAVIPVIFAIALVVFLWGIYKYFIAGSSKPEQRQEGAKFAMWGIIGFFVMVSVWGLVNILLATINVDRARPQLPFFGGSDLTGGEKGIFSDDGGGSSSGDGSGDASSGDEWGGEATGSTDGTPAEEGQCPGLPADYTGDCDAFFY